MPELSHHTKKLIEQYQQWHRSLEPKEEVSTIHVDEVAAKVAAFYEKIRDIIDWQEEHLLKRRAIERMLKRRLFAGVDLINGTITETKIAEPLVLELIRGGHFQNDTIETSKIQDVQQTIDKYVFLHNQSPSDQKKSKLRLYNWLVSICACEIEEILSPSLRERALIHYMFTLLQERIILHEGIIVIGGMTEKVKAIQISIATQRALFKLDESVISYHLLKYQYPEWKHLSGDLLQEIANDIYAIQAKLDEDLHHPLGPKFYHVAELYDTPYLLLGDVLSADPISIEEKINNPETLEGLVRDAYQKRLKTLKSRLGRAAFYTTLSIFLTKIALAIAIEVPFDRYVIGEFNSIALAVNILVPPTLMFLLVSTIRPPKQGNLDSVVLETMKIAYAAEKKDSYEIRVARKRGIILQSFITVVYFLSFLVSLGLITWVLWQLQFSLPSYIIFIVFVSLIAFAGTKVRQRSRELHITVEKERLFHLILDPFAIPLIQLGKWLTAKWQKYNVIVSLFNVLIDVPFVLFVEFLEQWRYFLKEKKEDIHG